MRLDPRRTRQVHIDTGEEIDFRPVKEMLARNVRRPVEPGVWRSLVIAMIVGIGMGLFIYYFKPGPKSAEAARPAPRMMNTETVQQETAQQDLFQLPDWDQAAYDRDHANKK